MVTYAATPCLLCASPGDELATAEELAAEIEQLWAFHGRRLRPETPPQHLTDRLAFSQRPPLRLAWCARCGLAWRNPAERAHEVDAIYADAVPERQVLQALHDTQRAASVVQARRLTDIAGGPGTLLEVGSFVGAFLAAARELGWVAEGVDVNVHANRFARSLGLSVTDGELGDITLEPSRDAICIWNCLDQLPDPRAALRAARERLEAGGMLALRVPNGGLYARLRRSATRTGVGASVSVARLAHNNLLGFPYRWGFTPSSLSALVRACGFEVVRVVGDVLVPRADEWTRRWARIEERVVKHALRLRARQHPESAPWFELYARARG